MERDEERTNPLREIDHRSWERSACDEGNRGAGLMDGGLLAERRPNSILQRNGFSLASHLAASGRGPFFWSSPARARRQAIFVLDPVLMLGL